MQHISLELFVIQTNTGTRKFDQIVKSKRMNVWKKNVVSNCKVHKWSHKNNNK